MFRSRFSLRASFVLTVLGIGIVGMAFTYLSSEIYRHAMLDTQRATMSDFLRAEVNGLREEFEAQARVLARQAQRDPAFTKALSARSTPAMNHALDDLFQYAASIAVNIQLNGLYLFDGKLAPLATFTNDPGLNAPPCPSLLARLASAPERSRSAHRVCLSGDKPYYVAVVPLQIQGGGYFYMVGDLLPALTAVERKLDSPLRLHHAEGAVIYQSPEWPSASAEDRLVANYVVYASAAKVTPIFFELSKDMSAFSERISSTRYLILLSLAIATGLLILLALLAHERTVLKPLHLLTSKLQRLRHDKTSLGEQIDVVANSEMTELVNGFNHVSTHMRQMNDNLTRAASIDALTDLPNRTCFRDRLQQAIVDAKSEGNAFALIVMDLDRFKDINDTLGHQTGDLLLTQVAQRLLSKLRDSDTVARIGGDEFAVLLPALDAKHAGTAARMLLQALRAPFTIEGYSLNISASIGITSYPEHGIDASVLMQRADVAMYSAKRNSIGYAFYDAGMDQNYPMRLTLLSDLHQAVQEEQFELYYQPIVNLATNKVTGIEALTRWRHPRDGILLPGSFIPLLEQSGLIRGLMSWVVSEALKRVRTLRRHSSPLAVSVNLSIRDLQDPSVVESIAEQLSAHGVEASALVIEVTEGAVMTDASRTSELLGQLAALGIRISIDDFGIGFSSLNHLKKLPVSELKIDKSFIIGMATDENDAAIVRTSIDLAHNLGLKVVAEGVENETALKRLRTLGCDLAQGNYVGRPLTGAELEEWLAQSAWGFANVEKPRTERHNRMAP